MSATADRLTHFLLRRLERCQREHGLLGDGDRVAVGVSGGVDSTALLSLLARRHGPERLELVAIHVRPAAGEPCAAPADPTPLQSWVEGLGVTWHVVTSEPPRATGSDKASSPCFHCAWRRRKALFTTARELGCNKLALGHQADDLAETTLLNLFFHAELSTMEPRREFFGGLVTLIRPLAYVSKRELVRLARVEHWPKPPAPCEQAGGSRRELMRRVLRLVEDGHPRAKRVLWRAVTRDR